MSRACREISFCK
uniref:Uncharacterized protein n=1 Tax=Rhizophora mucronata TaxID=61149 RepID=A0A2P2J0M3_RHIMU